MTTYYSTTSYQTFSVYEPLKSRGNPPPKEMPKMTDEEFDAAFKDLLFGGKQEKANV